MGNFAPLSPILWLAICHIIPGGRPPQVLQLDAWDCAPPSLWLCRPLWRAASYLVPSWSLWWITSAQPLAEYDARLASTLPTATALDLLAKLDEAYAESHLSWQNVLSGSEPAMRDQPPPAPRHARGITPDDGDGDDEHPHTRRRTKIQGVITAYIDSGVHGGLLQMHESEGSLAARMRLAELGDSSVDHTWLWRLNPRHGSTVRFRLGCAGPAEPITCAACNSGILDTGAAHASCCALGEATRGHNAVSSLIHAAAQQCDHTSEMEVPGLIPGTDLRPADVLTSALGNAYTALDVSICSPHASEAGVNCTQSRVQAKLEHYGPHLAALLRQNISYTPIVWSAYGRPHPDTLTVLRSLSKSIARKRNIASAEVVFHRLHSSITLEIWRRSARQVRACWPVAALPGQPGSGCLASAGGLVPAPGFPPAVSRAPGLWSLGASPSSFLVFSVTGCPPALRTRHDCPWRLTILVPQGLSFGVCLPIAPAVSFALGSQRIFCPLSLVLRAPACLMSRGDELRQLAAQLSVLAALEDSIALGLSRVMGPAGPGRAAAPPDAGSPSAPAANAASAAPPVVPSPSHEVAASLLRSAQGCIPSDPHSLPFSCAAAQTCTASQFQRRLWLAWIGCSRGVGTGHGLGHQELPTGPASSAAPFPRLSRSPRCLSRLAAICRRLWALCTLRPGLRGPSCHGVCVQLRRRMGRSP